jgi:subfamily B ATP-binding cassette protein HlyB/CyaB
LKRPKILIFDEATSSLDQATAEQVAQTIGMLGDKMTVLFITHQTPLGLQCDLTISMSTKRADPVAADAVPGLRQANRSPGTV